MSEIEKVAVIGAGVMGGAIAAHVANAGVPVLLMDVVPEGAANRNTVAEGAIEKLLKSKPAAFMHKDNAKLIAAGNVEDHLHRLDEVDWILEAVVEDLEVKRSLYQKLESVRKPGSIVSSNTSTIPLHKLVSGLPEAFARDFMITHFFNPPRYMRLLEIVRGDKTRPEAASTIRAFTDLKLGKGVVDCKDTPGFIANRLGIYWMQCAVAEAIDAGLRVEEADAVIAKAFGTPKTGVFGLLDLVGLDLATQATSSLITNLPPDDACRRLPRAPELFDGMIANGYTGRKGKGGFYRRRQEAGARVKEARDLETGDYRPAEEPRLESLAAAGEDLHRLLEHPERSGTYASRVLLQTLSYAGSLVPEVATSVAAVDRAMRLGYNWKYGPFELLDRLGADWFRDRTKAEGLPVPALIEKAKGKSFYRTEGGGLQYLTLEGDYADVEAEPGLWRLTDIKRKSKPIAGNASASLWDVGDGIACLEFHSKMNTFDRETLVLVRQAIEIVERDFRGLIIGNDDDNFSAGVNLGLTLFAANVALWPAIEDMVKDGQDTFKALKHAPFPVVGAPSGLALGAGCEILLHCDAIQAHGESYIGLVEAGVGLIPAWGGCKELLIRWITSGKRPGGPMPAIAQAFETIAMAKVSTSAAEARDRLFLRPSDGITMNRERVLADAKARALELADDYRPPEPVDISLPGAAGRAALFLTVQAFAMAGKATAHDQVVAKKLAAVLSGGNTKGTRTLTEDELLSLERNAVMELIRHPSTLARMEHILETGRPLRN